MKKSGITSIFLLSILVLGFPMLSNAKTVIPIYNPSAGGSGYIMCGAIAAVLNKYVPEIQAMVEATGGTVQIAKLLGEKSDKKEPAFGNGDSKFLYMAYSGKPPFEKAYPSLRGMCFNFGARIQLIVPKNSPVKSFFDLKGKRIGVGAAGSGTSQIALELIEEHGVTKEMFKPLWLGYNEVAEGIKDGSIDGGFISGLYPIPQIQQLSTEKDIRIVPVDEGAMKKILGKNPYYYSDILKPGSYKGVTQDTLILVFGSSFSTHSGFDADLMYKIMKTMFEKRDELMGITSYFREMTTENARKTISIPFHPGAEKYLKEVGAMK